MLYMSEFRISNYDEIKQIVSELNYKTNNDILFRGEPKCLVPSLINFCKSDFDTTESFLLEEFKKKSNLMLRFESSAARDWEIRIAAREYGLASSLMDWSNSLDIALEFATNNFETKNLEHSSLWVLDKSNLKQITINQNTDIRFENIVEPTIIQFTDYSGLTYHRRRLIQGGYFLFQSTEDINTPLENNSFFSDILHHIVIPKEAVFEIRKQLSAKLDLKLDTCVELNTSDESRKVLCKKLNSQI